MKTHLKKLASYILISVIVNLLLFTMLCPLSIANAAPDPVPTPTPSAPATAATVAPPAKETPDPQGVINEAKAADTIKWFTDRAPGSTGDSIITNQKSCITTKEEEAYLITVIEEPLDFKEEAFKEDIVPAYKSKYCYRVYLSYTDKKKDEKVHTALSVTCPDDIKNGTIFRANTPNETPKIKATCSPVQVLFSRGGTSLIEGYIGTLYRWAAGIVGLIAVAVIIISGVQISIAGGDTQTIDDAKGRIIKSIAGIALLFLSGLILYTINPTFFTITSP
jgi:hypothetical protein